MGSPPVPEPWLGSPLRKAHPLPRYVGVCIGSRSPEGEKGLLASRLRCIRAPILTPATLTVPPHHRPLPSQTATLTLTHGITPTAPTLIPSLMKGNPTDSLTLGFISPPPLTFCLTWHHRDLAPLDFLSDIDMDSLAGIASLDDGHLLRPWLEFSPTFDPTTCPLSDDTNPGYLTLNNEDAVVKTAVAMPWDDDTGWWKDDADHFSSKPDPEAKGPTRGTKRLPSPSFVTTTTRVRLEDRPPCHGGHRREPHRLPPTASPSRPPAPRPSAPTPTSPPASLSWTPTLPRSWLPTRTTTGASP